MEVGKREDSFPKQNGEGNEERHGKQPCLYYSKLMMESMGYGSIYEACLKSNANFSSESILVNIGKALDIDINDNDISIAHPLPSYINEALPKIIVKFTRRDVRNAVYGKRNALPELKPSQRPDLNGLLWARTFTSQNL